MPSTRLLIGGPYHLRKMKTPNEHDTFVVQQMPPDAHLIGPVKAYDEVQIRTLTYRPRQWFGNEVWVLDGMSDSVAMDQLLTSVFNKGRSR